MLNLNLIFLLHLLLLVLSKSISNLISLLIHVTFSGQGKGFDIDLIKLVSDAVSIPVIASSGAGAVEHFSEVFKKTNASAALAAGIFHRKEVAIGFSFSSCFWLSADEIIIIMMCLTSI